MAKGITAMNIDQDVLKEFQRIVGKGNVSSKVEEFMTSMTAIHNKDLHAINIKMVEKKIDELQTDITKSKAELERNISLLDEYNKMKQEKEMKDLEDEKKRIEQTTHCINCKSFIDGKKFETAIGYICHSCFDNALLIGKSKLWWPA